MDKKQASSFRRHKLKIVKSKMDVLRMSIDDAYEKNEIKINQKIEVIVSGIIAVYPLNSENLSRTFKKVMDSFFYKKRPSKAAIEFLDDLGCYPSEVIYKAVMAYSMFLIDNGASNKKHSLKYFNGFIRNSFYDYQKETRKIEVTDVRRGMPDDL